MLTSPLLDVTCTYDPLSSAPGSLSSGWYCNSHSDLPSKRNHRQTPQQTAGTVWWKAWKLSNSVGYCPWLLPSSPEHSRADRWSVFHSWFRWEGRERGVGLRPGRRLAHPFNVFMLLRWQKTTTEKKGAVKVKYFSFLLEGGHMFFALTWHEWSASLREHLFCGHTFMAVGLSMTLNVWLILYKYFVPVLLLISHCPLND